MSYKNLEETTQLLTSFLLINNATLDIKEVSFLDAVNEIGAIYPHMIILYLVVDLLIDTF